MLDHPNIIKMYESFNITDQLNKQWNVIVLNMCGGGVLSEYIAQTQITEFIARYLFWQIIQAVQFMHSKKIAHMDLRIDNILLDNEGNVRVTDFGSALQFGAAGDNVIAGTMIGQPSHMPPEMLAGN